MAGWREWRDGARAPMDRDRAWTCLGMNLAVLPGLGTAMAGRLVEGALQAALALAGAIVLVCWFFLFLGEWSRLGHYPWGGGEDLEVWLAGIGLFAFGWLWALMTSLGLLRSAGGAPGPR